MQNNWIIDVLEANRAHIYMSDNTIQGKSLLIVTAIAMHTFSAPSQV